jgi:hypothetical protein
MKKQEYSWDFRKNDPMMIDIKLNNELLFSIYVGEIIESAGRKHVMKHVKVCEDTPWLSKWHTKTNTINKDGLFVNSNGDIDDARDADFDDLGMGN